MFYFEWFSKVAFSVFLSTTVNTFPQANDASVEDFHLKILTLKQELIQHVADLSK